MGPMRTLGVLGGMSWESTAVVYRLLNQGVAARRGGLHSAPLLLASVDFAPVAALQSAGQWDRAAALLAERARGLQAAGAQALLLATNTMHKVAGAIERDGGLPLLHIADATGAAVAARGLRHVGFLGTGFAMDDPACVTGRLAERFGLRIELPLPDERALVHRVIYDELCRGIVRDASRAAVQRVIAGLAGRGAQAVVLGCTEICLLIDAATSPLPTFDTTALHAAAAVDWLLADDLAPGDTA
jgi:aspartate racemase